MKPLRSCVSALAVCVAFLHGCAGETPGPNRQPVARAGSDLLVAISEPVVLDAGSSFDPDGDLLSYHWDLVAAPPGGSATIVKPNQERAGLAPDAPGTWVVRLTVTDYHPSSEPDVILIRAGEQVRPTTTICEGDVLVVYDWQGQEISREHCQLGCNATAASPHPRSRRTRRPSAAARRSARRASAAASPHAARRRAPLPRRPSRSAS